MKKVTACFLFFTLILSTFAPAIAKAHSYRQGELVIIHPWARAMLPAARVGSAFMEIRNEGESADRLLAVRSSLTERIEIHSMVMEGEVMKMREVEAGLDIPAQGSVTLEPGGYHLMFFSPSVAFKQGEHFHAELVFEQAGRIEVMFVIDAMGARTSGDNAAHDAAEQHHHDH